jgi:hypothetical protein
LRKDKSKKNEGVDQVIAHILSKQEDLNSILSAIIKEKKKKNERKEKEWLHCQKASIIISF